MPNIAAMLKEEISRLSRKEIRRQMLPVRKASAAHRRHIAALKREIARLEKLVTSSARRGKAAAAPAKDAPEADGGQRFQARGLRSLRARLGLSAAELAKLVGVSAQSVYNWETKKATPRRSQVAQIAALRGLGKKEVRARLEGGGSATPAPAAAKKRGRKPRVVAKRAAKPARKVGAKRGRRKAA